MHVDGGSSLVLVRLISYAVFAGMFAWLVETLFDPGNPLLLGIALSGAMHGIFYWVRG